ncbi:MAG: glutamine--fructose-6-phosphate transaminase (isomerizing) [Nanoarchaeota archaeon]|nr:glutamine--fructose-6-phosphate transaminase (isomerizing) [Nanoarchaeota archaeon]
MCGIIGYIGEKEAAPILLDGLKKLEYRGYDSAGFCLLDNGVLKVIKDKGKISEFDDSVELRGSRGNVGIAHTRWATHGEPSKINAHPHTDCKGDISIAHNGIIENHSALRELLIAEGHTIISDTDSEVLAHLIEKFYDGDLEEALIGALRLVEGTFGLVVLSKNEEKICVARKGSPLIIGIGNNEMFVSSDATAILNHTRRVIYLNDDEVASINKKEYNIRNIDGGNVDPEIHEIKWNVGQIEKKGFKHFMLKEIFEQPSSLENVLRGRVKGNETKSSVDVDYKNIKRILITACGTSWHSALIGKHLIEKMVGIPVEVDYASEFRYRNPLLNSQDLVIVISQSGETADTLAALREAKSKGAHTMGIINVVGSTIARESGSGIYLHAGPEIGVASTKAFTSQVLTLFIFALHMAQQKGLGVDAKIFDELKIISKKVSECLLQSEEIKNVASNFKNIKNFLYLGRGINFPVALEGALKLKEISYIHAEGYPAAEMKHGPIALIDEHMPVVFIATNGATYEKILSNMEEVKSRGGVIITVTDRDDVVINRLSDYVMKVPSTICELSPILNSIPLQLLAYHIADLRGLDVDKPRNLAKSVTVE